tara:strand:- start:90 stop:1016 length:927 start_codon:yes stop_codon:yes gene_type:complete
MNCFKQFLFFSTLCSITFFSNCSEDSEQPIADHSSQDTDLETANDTQPFIFHNNLHESLPIDWIDEFNIIITNLKTTTPIKVSNDYYQMSVFAWNSIIESPFEGAIGDVSGACICGDKNNNRIMVLTIPSLEFEYEHIHRYSVIPHEYFHAYQMGLDNQERGEIGIRIKWLIEGTAASFESLYIQENYGYNYFLDAQTKVDISVSEKPEIFESYEASWQEDENYASSVFMVLVLTKELQKQNFSEEEAFRLIYYDFWSHPQVSQNDWASAFEEVFSIKVEAFYEILQNYPNDVSKVLPSDDIKLGNIF